MSTEATINRIAAERTPWNPSRRAMARVKDRLPVPTECPHCGSPVDIAHHRDIYGSECGSWPWMYVCTGEDCDARVGMHPFTNLPLGTMATAAERRARQWAKQPFEQLWKGRVVYRGGVRVRLKPVMTRSQAYQALAKALCIPEEHCHFGYFDIETCRRARKAIEGLHKELGLS